MFGFFSRNNKPKEELKCAMCKIFKPIVSDMGDECCFTCLVQRYKSILNGRKPDLKPEIKDEKTNIVTHTEFCTEALNKCYHTVEFKDSCVYKENCEFVTPTTVRYCSENCPLKH